MRTQFTAEQLQDADTADCASALRACVHCGFCTATCPTYLLTGDALDSPRGRIRLIQEMLESGTAPSARTVKHLDRCLSCLGCETACPSGVDYSHLIDEARAHIEEHYERPTVERFMRRALMRVMPSPVLFRVSLLLGKIAGMLGVPLPAATAPLIAQARKARMAAPIRRRHFPAAGARKARVALMPGCVQQSLTPETNAAAIRFLTRHGVEVVIPKGAGCCGSIHHHGGDKAGAATRARANVAAWAREMEGEGLDAIIVTASGCGSTVKEYGRILRESEGYAHRGRRAGAIAKDILEFVRDLDIRYVGPPERLRVAFQEPCSLQHGQKLPGLGAALLAQAGYEVAPVAEGHLCCGSAGTYSLYQPELSGALKARKLASLAAARPQVIASDNFGCMQHLAGEASAPFVHAIELLDWASGGPKPAALGS